MPSHLKRYYGAGDLHFITCSCYHREPLLGSAERRDLFLTVLENVRQKYGFVILGYVVMREHFHLLISEPQEQTPSVVMQALKLGFARRVQPTMLKSDKVMSLPHFSRTERARNGAPDGYHFWQRRFYDFNVRTEAKRIEKLRYIHRNPVTRGLVERPEQWDWSSFRYYVSREAGPVKVDAWEVLKMKVRSAG